jgi:hypothetical protein
MEQRVFCSKESSSQPKEPYDVIDLDPRFPPFYISVLISDFVLHNFVADTGERQMSCPFES